ncbi:cytidine deaminase [Caproiciproducens galactitolivorans]|uniref:Cytidine deaminase n=1 Tax=Caproiciproducens galactitolivorans TaxID=642589 RepID=A0A4Z0XW31_9FIRM|nr:cytidine deaminase [Caproiciproducens galactitolivorans]QEY33792.1 cytidine deaminase [Caproiciproducens galactitolivorans]TGJ75629.1 cytidine deaminase [Caproiciproducens galactitolivorans]
MENARELISAAVSAREMAYTPYSNFKVGAALLSKSGRIYKGCNIENAAFTPTNCAERTAFFKAVSEGELAFECIAIVGGKGDELEEFCAPCGVCRQVMMEFCDPDEFKIILGTPEKWHVYTLRELLPFGFGKQDLEKSHD